jgi:flavin-dependent dehydrogenase
VSDRCAEPAYDVVILGGGLAGLSLARQLQLEAPSVRALVAEKRLHPVREAAFKVGESTVEIGAHYFQRVLDLEPHLRSAQLEKLGLRYFFPHGDNRDLKRRVELGAPEYANVPSFQLDRGRFENMLLQLVRSCGAEVLDDCTVRAINLGRANHEVTLNVDGTLRTVTARWVVDASGRASLLKRKLGLARPSGHGANASWFRFKTRLRVDDWSDDPAWAARVPTRRRWLSTNHLMGKGYWVWFIPLGSGSTSVGIVADSALHPFNRISRFERALDWLREFEPQAAGVVEAHAGDLEDFLALQHFAHGCARVFSPDRWALTGEAGVFTDPFYSPGSDFIAIGNECIADLIAREVRGEDVSARAESFNQTYLRLFDAFIRLYEGQYPIMGNAQVMMAKVTWDNACYWGITALLFFQRRYRRPEFIESIEPLMRRFFVMHARMQSFFRAWDAADQRSYADAGRNVLDLDFLRRLMSNLNDPMMDDDCLRARLGENYALLEAFAQAWQAVASEDYPALARFVPERRDSAALNLDPVRLTPSRVPV